MITLSHHGRQRGQQRAVRLGAIEACVAWGQPLHQGLGRTAYHLGRREVAASLRLGIDLRSYGNTAVVVAGDGTVVTVMRTSDRGRLRRTSLSPK